MIDFKIMTALLTMLLGLGLPSRSFALDKAQVLPKSVNYLSVRFGMLGHLGEIYGASGGISYKGDTLSRSFDLNKIKKYVNDEKKQELDQLIKTLNTFGNSKLAEQVNLGTLQFEVDPSIRYAAPIYARGITERFTLGIALPIINYKADIMVRQVNSNVPQLKSELSAVTANSEELKRGLDRLDESLVTAFSKLVQDRGYKPLRNREDNLVGDVQLIGLYHLVKGPRENLILKTGLVLPTGPRDDPDDLSDLNNQHQTAVGTGLINDYSLTGRWTLGAGGYFLARLPDRAPKRVPNSRDDPLPGPERKETVARDLGDTLTANANIRYQINDYFEAAAGMESGTKSHDRYSGNNPWDYSVMSENTYQNWNKTILVLEYSTVTGYLGGRDAVPFTITYDFSDIFAGNNIERQQVHELGVRLYF